MKKIIFLLTLIFCVFLIGCVEPTNQDLNIPKIKIHIENISTFDMNEISNLSGVIPLETTDDNLIGEIKKVFLTDSCIVVWDSKTKNVLLFTADGHYMHNIGSMGGAPEEYITITDVYLDGKRKCIQILDNSSRKIVSYDLSGKYLGHHQNNYFLYSFLPTDNGYWGTNGYQNHERYDLIYLDNNDMKIQHGYFPCEFNLMLMNSNNFTINEKTNEIFYHYSYSDTIYKIENTETITPFLAFDFGNKKNPYTIDSKEFAEEFKNLEYTGQINNVYSYGNKLFFSFRHTYGVGKTLKSYHVYMSLDDLKPIVYQLDIKYSPLKAQPLPEIIGLSKGKLIYQILPEILPEERLTEAFKDMNFKYPITPDSNPVLVLYDLK